MNKFISAAIGVELAITGESQKIFFPDIPALRGKRIKHIDCCTGVVKAPSSRQCVTYLKNNCSITLMEQATQCEYIKSLPVSALNSANNNLFINKEIDLPNSYITYPDAAVEAGKSVYFVFWLDEPAVWGRVPKKNNRTQIQPLELKIVSGRTYFGQNQNLRNTKVQNILFADVSITPTGNQGVGDLFPQKAFLTLRNGAIAFFDKVPIYLFDQKTFFSNLKIQNISFDLQSSYIDVIDVDEFKEKSAFFNIVIDDNKKNICSCKCNH